MAYGRIMAVIGLILYVSLFLVIDLRVDAKFNTYTVVPGQSANSCASINHTECSLMYYAANPSEYFTEDNTLFLFMAGHHLLVNSTCVQVANISNLTLRGNTSNVSETRVVCNGQHSGSLSFFNIRNLTIENLSFIRCSDSAVGFIGLTALEIHLTHNLIMNNVYINGTAGYGLSLTDLFGSSAISNTTIESSYSTSNASGGNIAFYCSDNSTSQEDAMLTHSLTVTNSHFQKGVNTYKKDSNYYPPSSGLYISIYCQTKLNITLDHVVLAENSAYMGGNLGIKYNGTSFQWTVSIVIVNSEISHGTGSAGGGISVVAFAGSTNNSKHTDSPTTQILTIENTLFELNTAYFAGAGVYFRLHRNPFTAVGRIAFRTNCTFKDNKLAFPSNDTHSHGGVAIHIVVYALPEYTQHKIMFFILGFTNCIFLENHILFKANYSTVFRTGVLYVQNVRTMHIEGCKIMKNNCTGIVALKSTILFHGENIIRGNTAFKGAGMFFCSGSMMHLFNGTTLIISENIANWSGGGIYVENECSPAVSYCFFQVDNIAADNTTLHQTQVHLINNTAVTGCDIYGGVIDSCILFNKPGQEYTFDTPGRVFNATFHIQNNPGCDLTSISSDPTSIGFCEINSTTTTEYLINDCPQIIPIEVTPGSIFQIPAVIMGQRYGLVAGVVDTKCLNKSCSVPDNYHSQLIHQKTNKTKLTYSVTSGGKGRSITLELVADDYYFGFPTYKYQPSYIHVTIKKCPLGFREENHECSCYFLKGIVCNITTQTLNRSNDGWIGYKKQPPNDTTDIIYHPYCPLGYCLNKDVVINTTHEHFDQDAQCAHNRAGLLCGNCSTNYSLGFGSSQCLPHCSSELQFLRVIGLIAVCGVAGVLLVVLLTLLNLTCSRRNTQWTHLLCKRRTSQRGHILPSRDPRKTMDYFHCMAESGLWSHSLFLRRHGCLC